MHRDEKIGSVKTNKNIEDKVGKRIYKAVDAVEFHDWIFDVLMQDDA